MRVVHLVIKVEPNLRYSSPQQKADYAKLAQWLKDHGESFKEARADIARWRSWSGTPAQKAALRRAEIARVEAEEKAEREAQENAERDAGGIEDATADDSDGDNPQE